jgi:hypothetical protein
MHKIAIAAVAAVATLSAIPLLANRADATTLGSATNARLPADVAQPFEEVGYRHWRRRHVVIYPRFRSYAYYPRFRAYAYSPYRSYHYRRFHHGYY